MNFNMKNRIWKNLSAMSMAFFMTGMVLGGCGQTTVYAAEVAYESVEFEEHSETEETGIEESGIEESGTDESDPDEIQSEENSEETEAEESAKSVDFGRDAFFATVFGKLVQGVYGDEDNVVMGVNELDHLLHVAVDIGA